MLKSLPQTLRISAAVSALAAITLMGGLSACSKAQTEKTEAEASSVASDAGQAVSTAGAAISDAVTPDTPQEFTTKAAIANMFEIDTSKLALKTSKNADVKAFAKMMVADHTKAGAAFKIATISDKDVAPPKALDEDHQKKLDDLKTKTGDEFDQAYISLQKDAHADAVSLFDNYAKNGTDETLKKFATDTLPTLQAHKDAIDKM